MKEGEGEREEQTVCFSFVELISDSAAGALLPPLPPPDRQTDSTPLLSSLCPAVDTVPAAAVVCLQMSDSSGLPFLHYLKARGYPLSFTLSTSSPSLSSKSVALFLLRFGGTFLFPATVPTVASHFRSLISSPLHRLTN